MNYLLHLRVESKQQYIQHDGVYGFTSRGIKVLIGVRPQDSATVQPISLNMHKVIEPGLWMVSPFEMLKVIMLCPVELKLSAKCE